MEHYYVTEIKNVKEHETPTVKNKKRFDGNFDKFVNLSLLSAKLHSKKFNQNTELTLTAFIK